MTTRDLNRQDPLDDFEKVERTFDGLTKTVYVTGAGPAVIVMPEIPGITPHVARFARWVRDAGFTVYMPSLFGIDGAVAQSKAGVEVFQRACVAAEFKALEKGGTSPASRWLMALAREAHGACGGPGVGAIGMCFTGNFALTMMLEPATLAPVLCQPALPLDDEAAVDSSPEELAKIRARLEKDDLTVRAYRFDGDALCKAARFAVYEEALGERFEGRVLPDEAATMDTPPFYKDNIPTPHSVVTVNLIDRAGEPTAKARDEILDFFKMRLVG